MKFKILVTLALLAVSITGTTPANATNTVGISPFVFTHCCG